MVEAGAGPGPPRGRRARGPRPACAPALRYVLVERSARCAPSSASSCRSSRADEALGPFAARRRARRAARVRAGVGPVVDCARRACPRSTSTASCSPTSCSTTCRSRRRDARREGWSEVRVGADGELRRGARARGADLAHAAASAALTPPRARQRLPVPVRVAATGSSRAAALLDQRRARGDRLRRQRTAICSSAVSGWLRTYRAHERGGAPLDEPGEQDITADVRSSTSVERRTRRASARSRHTQADWLREPRYRGPRRAGGAPGGAGAAPRRSRGDRRSQPGAEAAALLDPAGLGAHRVLVLTRG